jgi:hypothetical protein
MRSVKFKISGSCVLLFVSMSLFAQNFYRDGYIVNNTQDTVNGFIRMKGSIQNPSFTFKPTLESTPNDLTPEEVAAIVITNYRYFRSISIKSDRKFAQALVDGNASLLLREKTFYFLKDEKLNVLEIEQIEVESKAKVNPIHKKKTYIGILKSSMSDCPSVWNEIDRARLAENSLTQLVDHYNQCTNQASTVFKKDIPKFKLTVSGLLALTYVPLKVDVLDQFNGIIGYFEQGNFNSLSVSPGIGFNLSSPRLDDRFSFYTELRYVRNLFEDNVYYPSTTYNQNDITIKASYIYFPISFMYEIPFSDSKGIFFKGGLLKTFLLSSDYSNYRTNTSTPGVPPLNDKDRFQFYSSQTGYMLSTGYQFRLTEKLNGGIELKYENTGPIINSATVSFIQNVFSLQTSVSF